jgi:LmbE family N-acetylglucosaminyl deacetylase
VWGWTIAEDTILPASQIAGWRLDISPNLAAKRRAIAAHASQYGDVITDDPTGFHLPADLLRTFDRPFEVFLSDR